MASKDEMVASVIEALAKAGIPLERVGSAELGSADAKVLCLAGSLSDSRDALSESTRDQVVMVRLDRSAVQDLDAWVETGALRSRSEAAALFIREGLALRARELEELRGPLEEFRAARTRLKSAAEQVLGSPEEEEEDDD